MFQNRLGMLDGWTGLPRAYSAPLLGRSGESTFLRLGRQGGEAPCAPSEALRCFCVPILTFILIFLLELLFLAVTIQ